VVRRNVRRATSALGAAIAALAVGAAIHPVPAAAAPTPSISPAQVQAQQWWIGRLGLRQTWAVSKGAGVTVAVLDAGVDAKFGDLRGAVLAGFAPGGSGTAQTDTDPAMHGTRMADEIAGRGTGFGLLGVARAAKILPVLVPHDNTVPPTVIALNKLATMAHPPAVVNMSYGASEPCPADLQAAVRRAVGRGMILVAAAGNDGQAANPSDTPANCAGVVAVGALDVNGRAWVSTERQPYVSLGGPGVRMIGYDAQTPSGYGYASGTSDAAAIVSGTFAVVRSHFPTMSAKDVVSRVLYTAKQFEGAAHTRNDAIGYGVARPYYALKQRVPANAPNPVYDAVASTPRPASSAAPSASPVASAPASAPHTVTQPGATSSSGGGLGAGVIVAIIAAVVVVALVVLLLLRRRRPAHPAPPDNHFAAR
jgi:subtilisin family serine protease